MSFLAAVPNWPSWYTAAPAGENVNRSNGSVSRWRSLTPSNLQSLRRMIGAWRLSFSICNERSNLRLGDGFRQGAEVRLAQGVAAHPINE